MPFLCCGVKYSKNDLNTYWCIDTYILNTPSKKLVNNRRVVKEVVDVLTCKKNGCVKIQISRYGQVKGIKKRLELEELKGKMAQEYLELTSKIRIKQPVKVPAVNIPITSRNDFVYGKTIDGFTQRIRYLNEQGWASNEKIISKVKVM